MYLGSWKIDDLLTFTITTHDPTNSALTDADSNPSYRVYEDETGTPILTGSMAKLDDANTTGFYSEQITLSAANGFEKGKCYSIYISATVVGVTGATVRQFQVGAEVNPDSILDAALSEPSGVFTWAGASLRTVIAWLGLLSRNKLTQDDTETVAYADDGTTAIAEAPITKSGSMLTRGEWVDSP